MIRLAVALLTLFCVTPAAASCAPDGSCTIEGGTYAYATPPDWDGQTALPVLLYYHGHRSSAAAVLRSTGLRRAFVDAGFALVAPDGQMRTSGIRAWPARPGGGSRDDIAFTLDVLDDVARHLPVDPNRIWVGGFSAGGSMAWMMACYEGARFAGAFSLAGALRRPVPAEGCTGGAVRFLQIHGYTDRQVPLEGRGLGDWHQGDVFEALTLMRRANSCESRPSSIEAEGRFWCRAWRGCDSGADVEMCLHPGGHGLPKAWTDEAVRWMAIEP